LQREFLIYNSVSGILPSMNEPNREVYTPPKGPPQEGRPNPEIYRSMGAENINQMIRDFYGHLEQSSIRSLFPEDMTRAADKSAAFFVFLLGGPPIYQQQHGSPMMRKRHLPFRIDENARSVWLECFRKTLDGAEEKYQFPKEYLDEFWTFLDKFSSWMVNSKS